LKDGSELAEVTTGGRLFHTREAATPNINRKSIIECSYSSTNVGYPQFNYRTPFLYMNKK